MSIQLPHSVEEEIRDLAKQQGRDVRVLLEEAVRLYLEAVAVSDLGGEDLAETQAALLSELPEIPDWKANETFHGRVESS